MFGIDSRRPGGRVLLLVLALLLPLGCGGSRGSGDVDEIIDVEMPVEVDTSEDPQAVPRKPQLVGILPKGFPDDVPLYLPASLIDFGTSSGGRTVTLLSPHELAQMQPAYEGMLREAGWSLSQADNGLELRKESRKVRLLWRDGNPGSEYLLEY